MLLFTVFWLTDYILCVHEEDHEEELLFTNPTIRNLKLEMKEKRCESTNHASDAGIEPADCRDTL